MIKQEMDKVFLNKSFILFLNMHIREIGKVIENIRQEIRGKGRKDKRKMMISAGAACIDYDDSTSTKVL